MTHKELQDLLSYFSALFNRLEFPIICYNRQGTIVEVNSDVTKSFGYTTRDLVGTSLFSCFDTQGFNADSLLKQGKYPGFYFKPNAGTLSSAEAEHSGFPESGQVSIKVEVSVVPFGKEHFIGFLIPLPSTPGSEKDPAAASKLETRLQRKDTLLREKLEAAVSPLKDIHSAILRLESLVADPAVNNSRSIKPSSVKKEDLLRALMLTKNDRKEAAAIIGIPRESFYRLLKGHGIPTKRIKKTGG